MSLGEQLLLENKNTDIYKEFISFMQMQDMEKKAQDINTVLMYIAELQVRMENMNKEMQQVKEQLKNINQLQLDIVNKKDINMITKIQDKSKEISKDIKNIANSTSAFMRNTMDTYKKKGREHMNRFFDKGITAIKSKLIWLKEKLEGILNSCKEANRRLDAIGNEMKQIGLSVGNIGKIAVGKGENIKVLTSKEGVILTRMMKAPINKAISFLEKRISKVDNLIHKLEQKSERLNPDKEEDNINDKENADTELNEDNSKDSVLDKLHSNQEQVMKEKEQEAGKEKVVKKEEIQK